MQDQKLLKMQKPTALTIKEQVSVEVDEKLRKVASESTSKILSATKSNSNKHKPPHQQQNLNVDRATNCGNSRGRGSYRGRGGKHSQTDPVRLTLMT